MDNVQHSPEKQMFHNLRYLIEWAYDIVYRVGINYNFSIKCKYKYSAYVQIQIQINML